MAQFEMGNSHASRLREGTGTMAKQVKEAEQQEDQEQRDKLHEEEANEGDGQQAYDQEGEKSVPTKIEDAGTGQETSEKESGKTVKEGVPRSLDDSEAHVKRSGGAFEEENARGREIEVVHELLLVALGLGQYRAEDGATTLFEQDALFGDTSVEVAPSPAAAQHPPEAPAPDAAPISATPPPLPPRNNAADRGSDGATTSASEGAAGNAWGALKTGAASSWKNIATTSKGVKDGISSSFATPSNEEEPSNEKRKKGDGPTKPNEPCHYDSRARAIIFVAATAMDVQGMDAWMAEKVVAQTIYFIMSEGRDASTKQGQTDPLADLAHQHEQGQNARKTWMNRATGSAVAREKGKANWGKWAATGAGFAIGGAIIGLTGG